MKGRICTQCKQYKPISEFSWRRDKPFKRLTSRCHECRRKNYKENPERQRERAHEYYHNNKKMVLEKLFEIRRENPTHALFIAAKARAKKYGIKFDLLEKDITIPHSCPILGIPMIMGNGNCIPNSPSLDRINPKLGYIKDNIMVISHKANTIKSDATLEEIEMVAKFYRKLRTRKSLQKLRKR